MINYYSNQKHVHELPNTKVFQQYKTQFKDRNYQLVTTGKSISRQSFNENIETLPSPHAILSSTWFLS